MKKFFSIITMALIFINPSYSVPQGTQMMKACTFHGDTYTVVQPSQDCPIPQDIVLEGPPLDDDDSPKHQVHNPECFGYHFILR